jgi:hypothetical protein
LRRPGKLNLKPEVAKLLCPEKNHHALGCEFMLADLDAGILNVLGKLRKDKRPITRCLRKCLDLLDRVIG